MRLNGCLKRHLGLSQITIKTARNNTTSATKHSIHTSTQPHHYHHHHHHHPQLQEQGQEQTQKMLHLDGSTLEGGGQLVRNAIAISALTGQPIEITRIRGNRSGKQGLKGSHHAAISFLLDVCGGTAEKNQVGSTRVVFYPRGEQQREEERSKQQKPNMKGKGKTKGEEKEEEEVRQDLSSLSVDASPIIPIQPEYTIKLSTPGSVFLIFQALYPYLIYAGSAAGVKEPIRLNITGGTNASSSPSYDYVSQVLVPNFSKLGLPALSVRLEKRGWASARVELGTVSFSITPLDRPVFPVIDLERFERGDITRIDVTVLAPDTPVGQQRKSSGLGSGSGYKRRKKGEVSNDYNPYDDPIIEESRNDYYQDEDEGETESIRQFIERYTLKCLSQATKQHFQHTQPVINIHTSESTRHHSHTYLLLVAHTSTGFRLGRDALYSSFSNRSAETGSKERKDRTKNHAKKGNKSRGKDRRSREGDSGDGSERIKNMITQCVHEFMGELELGGEMMEKKRYLDTFMRDQIVVFQALGMRDNENNDGLVDSSMNGEREKERVGKGRLSLHSRTSMWVCEQMLGVSF